MNPFMQATQQPQYKDLTASQLYCPNCREATPVREFLLLVLPDGDLYEYRCAYCGMSLGKKRVKQQPEIQIVY